MQLLKTTRHQGISAQCRYYIDGKRVTYADYLDAIDNSRTHDTFITLFKNGQYYHYSQVR